ncbi:MAG TPA: hypothetical protein VGC16_11180 [Rhizomicrobium sp.]
MKKILALSAVALMSIAAPAFADRANDHKWGFGVTPTPVDQYGNPTDRNWKANARHEQDRRDRMNQDSMRNSVPDNRNATRSPTGL